jgi:hypothetical protein
MPFTAAELNNIANQALDFYMKGKIWSQTIQDKPLLNAMNKIRKTFPGGKEDIRGNVKGTYTTEFMGYSHDDTVSYSNPANVKQFNYPWKELHAGISLTMTELKKDGISVVDTNGERTSNHTEREVTAITGIFDDKLEDMDEGSSRSLNEMYWKDGTSSTKVFPGIQSIIVDDPTTGVAAGIDRALNSWWRNRSLVGANKITASASSQTLTKKLRSEARQLRRFGGRPGLVLCGSAFIDALELEVHEKGTYTDSGFVNSGKTDIGMADISMRGVGAFMYDPTLDDLGREKFCYIIDTRHLYPMVMDGEWMKTHAPSRPAEKYVLYRAITTTMGLICRKMNAHGVYEVA